MSNHGSGAVAAESTARVRIFDTTLRDGEQSPGATMTASEKVEIARALARLGVDVIEAGFPAASPDDLSAVRRIAESVGSSRSAGREPSLAPGREVPSICALARASKGDIDKAWEALAPAEKPRIHTFLATSDIHLAHKLRMSRDEVKARVREAVAYARSLCADVEFSPEDATRSHPDFLYEVLAIAIASGATTLNIPDTVGYATPEEFAALIAGIRQNVPGVEKVTLSVHCHNDLGLATANSLSGLRAGARQVEVAVNGIGERAGNTSLEEIVMALHTRAGFFGLRTGVDTTQLVSASRLVSQTTGMPVQPNKAIVGANAFAHEAGIHQDGMLKHQETYEIMRPETVGAASTKLVLGKHSGRHALKARFAELGYGMSDEELDRVFVDFKTLAERKKSITDADLDALARKSDLGRSHGEHEAFSLDALQVSCGTMGVPTATVRLRDAAGQTRVKASVGDGPIDATFGAIAQAAEIEVELLELSIRSVTEGIDALGDVTVRIRSAGAGGGRIYYGHGVDTDVVVASAKAYLAALNRAVDVDETRGEGRALHGGPRGAGEAARAEVGA